MRACTLLFIRSPVLLRSHRYLFTCGPHPSVEAQVHQPATGADLSQAARAWAQAARFVTGILKAAYTCFCFRDEKWVASYVDMFRHDTSYGRSLLSPLYAGPPAMKPSVPKRGRAGKEERREGDPSSTRYHFLCRCELRGGGHCLSPLCPSRALEQDEVIKAGARTSSQSHYFASCTPRCCCSASGLADLHS